MDDHTPRQSPSITDVFSGAPLDFIKATAACLMVVDHVNFAFFGHEWNIMWTLGRPVFPLFVFAVVCNLMRGTKASDYVGTLMLLGIVSQPFYATALPTDIGNTLFSLSAGIVLVLALRQQNLVVQHLVFAAAAVIIFSSLFRFREGLDYGIPGMVLPAALYLVLNGRWSHILWLVAMLLALNWFPADPWKYKPVEVLCYVAGGAVLIALVSLVLRNRPRFLPRYALHIFYPGHLAILVVIKQTM